MPIFSPASSMVDFAFAQRFSFSIFRLLEEFIKYAQKQKGVVFMRKDEAFISF
jgi:hypothetical protein